MHLKFIIPLIFGLIANQGECARIFGAFLFPSYSHQVIFQPIWKELSLRGHQVTVITPNPLNDPKLTNLTEIDISFTYKLPVFAQMMSGLQSANSVFKKELGTYFLFTEVYEAVMNYAPVRDIVNNQNDHYDLVLLQYNHIAHGMLPFAHKYKAPLIGLSSMGVYLQIHDALGNPTHPVVNPDYMMGLSGEMSFFERMQSLLFNFWYRAVYYWYFLPNSDKLARKYFGNDIPYLGDIERNTSLVMMSCNPLINSVVPNVPNLIEISQMHIREKKPLPKDIKQYLDSSPQGVVYFSLGSNVKSANLTQDLRKTIISALSELPYNVLWKWEADSLPDQPKNVMVRKWLPQPDVLGHKNIKVFFMQGGLQSLEESINNEVPVVGMPFFSDQPANMRKVVELGIGLMLDHRTVTKRNIVDSLKEVAENKKYKENVLKSKAILMDHPVRNASQAAWWIEYVLRHNGARHMRSSAADMTFFQYFMLDVVAFLLTCVITVAYVLIKLLRVFKKLVVKDKSKKAGQKKAKKH
ncbi:unnamed protein product [Phyllotreta striolata]|uniref:UDP-glucuronosyltransferase n=1 Tax=Phyllotreta striolata TaxID=444603 RepID=A0A9N9XJD8_PHYSR|nr:unnamed protein product [Phyllotreta striolata]